MQSHGEEEGAEESGAEERKSQGERETPKRGSKGLA
jgi:hypothetical protein